MYSDVKHTSELVFFQTFHCHWDWRHELRRKLKTLTLRSKIFNHLEWDGKIGFGMFGSNMSALFLKFTHLTVRGKPVSVSPLSS